MNRPCAPVTFCVTICALFALSGCASDQALRGALGERDNMIRRLRDEKAVLQQEVVHLSGDRAGLRSELSDLRDAQQRASSESATLQSVAVQPAAVSLQPLVGDLAGYGIEVERRGNGIVYLVPSAVTFGAGKAQLTKAGMGALAALATRIAGDTPGAALISVEGHTDSDPIRRSGFSSNRELSLARALAVHGFLVAEGDLPDERFVVLGYGPHMPLESNSSAQGKTRNRRVEIVVRAREK